MKLCFRMNTQQKSYLLPASYLLTTTTKTLWFVVLKINPPSSLHNCLDIWVVLLIFFCFFCVFCLFLLLHLRPLNLILFCSNFVLFFILPFLSFWLGKVQTAQPSGRIYKILRNRCTCLTTELWRGPVQSQMVLLTAGSQQREYEGGLRSQRAGPGLQAAPQERTLIFRNNKCMRESKQDSLVPAAFNLDARLKHGTIGKL